MKGATIYTIVLVCAAAQAYQAQTFNPSFGGGPHMSFQSPNVQPQQNYQMQMNPGQAQVNPSNPIHNFGVHGHVNLQELAQHFPQIRSWVQGLGGLRGKFGDLNHNVGGGFTGLLPMPNMHALQSKLHHVAHELRHLQMAYRTPENFYDGCGAAIRHCDWRPKPKSKARILSKFSRTYTNEEEAEQAQSEKPHIERFCTVTKTVCVGNTEHCVNKKNCDVAMRITEKSVEGRPKETKIVGVSVLDRCHWDDLSVRDGSSMAQRYVGVGFAAYDVNQQVTCGHLKASDFKLIVLEKNVPAGEDGAMCKHRAMNDTRTVKNIQHFISREIETWPALCESIQGNEEGVFNLKSFLKNHVSAAQYTSFFSPPFDFADNFEYQTSADGMLVTGALNTEE